MSTTQFTTIDDAYYYFFQAKGTPETSEGAVVKQRHLRTTVLLAWVAVDDAVAAFAPNLNLDSKGLQLFRKPQLSPKLRHIRGKISGTALDEAEFNRYRRVRNEIAHPKGNADTQLTAEQVDEVLAYCRRTIKIMYPHLVVWEEGKGRLSEFL